ncbi:hypothetical protein D3C81_1267450 [compost metagenome]
MGTYPSAMQTLQIVMVNRTTNTGIGARDHHHVSLTIFRELKQSAGRLFVQDQFNPFDGANPRHDSLRTDVATAPDTNEPTQGAVMTDKRIGDRADDSGIAATERLIENILQPYDVGRAFAVAFVAHAMVGNQRQYDVLFG